MAPITFYAFLFTPIAHSQWHCVLQSTINLLFQAIVPKYTTFFVQSLQYMTLIMIKSYTMIAFHAKKLVPFHSPITSGYYKYSLILPISTMKSSTLTSVTKNCDFFYTQNKHNSYQFIYIPNFTSQRFSGLSLKEHYIIEIYNCHITWFI